VIVHAHGLPPGRPPETSPEREDLPVPREEEAGVTELNWMQEYAATEAMELRATGVIGRREMLGRLAAICGSVGAAAAFLAACGDDSGSSTATPPTTTIDRRTTTTAARASTPPVTDGPPGHVLSVAASDPDVKAQNVTFAGPASEMFGYLAQPAASGTYPGVLVNHEIFGLTDHIRDVARRLAKVGFVALAVDLVSRAGGSDEPNADVVGTLVQGSVDDRIADLDAGVAFLESKPAYNGKLGVIGFCFGGGMTLSFAAASDDVLAAVPYYGPTPQPASVMRATKAAILAQYGADDARVNAGIPDLEAALAGKTFEKRVYPGAGHAFNNDTGGAYNEEVAVEAWGATIDWLRTHLA
jgi:carboxymethylenebutenolidase